MRERRIDFQKTLREKLKASIPPRYAGARLCHISKPVRDAIAQAPADAGFILYGPVGSGKTYALAALARAQIVRRRVGILRVTWDQLLLEVRATYGGDSERSEQAIVDKYSCAWCLIIEDLGATVPLNQDKSAFSTRLFTMILDWRIEHCLPTWITTNKREQDIGKSFDARVGSRLQLFKWIGIGGKDKRCLRK